MPVSLKAINFIFAWVCTYALACGQLLEYPIPIEEIESRGLVDLQNDSSYAITYRIWIEPDLVIEVGKRLTLTLYREKYDKKRAKRMVRDVEKVDSDIDPSKVLNYFDSVQLSDWKEAKKDRNLSTYGIKDGNRIHIEYHRSDSYRSYSLHGPMSDRHGEFAERLLLLLNFLDATVDPDKSRIIYYTRLATTDKDARYTLRKIKSYEEDWKELIEKNILPKMWGQF